MYTLRKIVYLDRPTQNYLTVLGVDRVPEAMRDYVQRIRPPDNSPFDEHSGCSCVYIMTDKTYTCSTGRGRVYPSGIAKEYLQVSDLAHAMSLWIDRGFTVNKDVYKILYAQDPSILAVFQ